MQRSTVLTLFCFLAISLAALAGCQPGDAPESSVPAQEADNADPEPAANAAWNTFVDRYIEDYFETHPGFAVVQGRHEFDGRLQDWSADGIAREISRLKQARDRALSFG